jgi:hypothetical protein
MDVREKLVELLTDNLPRIGNLPKCDNPLQYTMDEIVERIADHLIANGVTVHGDKDTNVPSKWISVKDRLPEKLKDVLVIRMNGEPDIEFLFYDGTWVGDTEGKQDVTHWMPLPQPPKGE